MNDVLLAAIAAAFDIVPGYKKRRSPHGLSAFLVLPKTQVGSCSLTGAQTPMRST